MRKNLYVFVIACIVLLLIYIITIQVIISSCYEKSPNEFFNSPLCREIEKYMKVKGCEK